MWTYFDHMKHTLLNSSNDIEFLCIINYYLGVAVHLGYKSDRRLLLTSNYLLCLVTRINL